MKKRMIAMVLALSIMLSITALAADARQYRTADALNELCLFLGKGNDYALEDKLTRAEGATLLVRVLGKEQEAKSWPLNIPFKDVPAWAIGYVGYAAAHGITNGTSPTTFSPNDELKDYMFLTLVLRALGYSDQGANGQFVWNDPYKLAAQVGLIGSAKADVSFNRGDAVEVLWKAMGVQLVGKNITLAQSLMAQGVFTKAEFAAAEKIQREGRKENAGTPIGRPGSSGSSGSSGVVNGPGQLPGTENDNGESDAPGHIIVPGNPNGGQNPSVDKSDLPWHNGGKQPNEYTWEEYEALDEKYKDAFYESFGDPYAFLEWQDRVQNGGAVTEPEELPWENGGKPPHEYTWAEFEALTSEQQMAFQKAFGSADAFAAWEEVARLWADGKPWENGGKAPDTYTWSEFQRLNDAQKMAFQNWFGNDEAFADWMEQAQATNVDLPWENGGKQPSEYTWEEFQDLSSAQQMAFQNWFGSSDAFENWMEQAQATNVDLPWENGGKQPKDYTWTEFEALSGDQQMAFQNWFANNGMDFEEWMYSVID